MKKKNGVTLTSLVVYLVLFTIFTVFTMNVSTNMNEGLLNDRGEAINYSNLVKLRTNIETSSLNSSDVTTSVNEITFSNGDVYLFDYEKSIVKKNGGILCTNVNSFSVTVEEENSAKKINISISFNKYLNELNAEVITCVEE